MVYDDSWVEEDAKKKETNSEDIPSTSECLKNTFIEISLVGGFLCVIIIFGYLIYVLFNGIVTAIMVALNYYFDLFLLW